ncbi:hypothetical protein RHSIM_Rhsim11G0039400 [Rhododendron simsii]|uniref:RNase H type-1 domain-containing protein n=1 Tax=Rhododendron simsii TaxID=118357 RepID=A0A834G6U5_RHOSS|nr:hypothetical protein RHSIM_Rhsim11G0039400 [Rhododendron simsii]
MLTLFKEVFSDEVKRENKANTLETLCCELKEPEEFPKEEPKPWVLQVDGSTTKEASGAGLILTSPKGQRLSYAFRFEFKTTHNEAEYETLVVGLELASAVGASHVLAKSDSQLLLGQVLGECTVKEEVMQKYADKVKDQVVKMQSFNIVRIPREENNEADYLAKLATAKEEAIPRNTAVRYLELPSIVSPDIQVQAINYSDSWIGPIVDYITNGTLPEDKVQQDAGEKDEVKQHAVKNDEFVQLVEAQFEVQQDKGEKVEVAEVENMPDNSTLEPNTLSGKSLPQEEDECLKKLVDNILDDSKKHAPPMLDELTEERHSISDNLTKKIKYLEKQMEIEKQSNNDALAMIDELRKEKDSITNDMSTKIECLENEKKQIEIEKESICESLNDEIAKLKKLV